MPGTGVKTTVGFFTTGLFHSRQLFQSGVDEVSERRRAEELDDYDGNRF